MAVRRTKVAARPGTGPGRGRPPGAVPGLSTDDVVLAALGLLDDVGLTGLTMRALADRLGTYPATVYWHVGNRDRVLALVVDRALRELVVPEPGSTDWREWVAAVAHEYRRVLHAHPNVAPLVAAQVLVSPPTIDLMEAILAVLAGAGFRGDGLAGAYNAIVGSVVGWVSVELAVAPTGPDPWQDEFARTVRTLDPATHPTIAANADVLADQAFALRWHGGRERPLDAAFDAAVRVWTDGLGAALAGSP
jgi:TetR/AcrR family transcriptional regulator, tetracycline repressor protein